MVKSPLRYPGGKSRAVKLISTLIPPFEEFREPFVGGGSIFIYLKQVFPSKRFWINDLYENLFHFWQACKNNPDKLIYQNRAWRNEFPEGKALHRYLINNIDEFDNLKKAAALFVFNRITFSGTTESGGFSMAAFEKRFTESSIHRIKPLSEILANTLITNEDYRKVVEESGKNVFIFLDPPYYSAKKSALYGKNGHLHKTFDHQRFASVMKTVKHHWLITYDDSPYIREIFSFAHIISWHLTYGMRNVHKNPHQIGEEILISNYLPSDNQLSLI